MAVERVIRTQTGGNVRRARGLEFAYRVGARGRVMPSFSKIAHESLRATLAQDFDQVRRLIIDTEESIRAFEGTLVEQTLKTIAEFCRELVLIMPRGDQGVAELNHLDQRLRSERDPMHHAARIAANLLIADRTREQGDRDGLMASFAVATLQVEIETFLEGHGVDAWGVAYTDVPRFEQIR